MLRVRLDGRDVGLLGSGAMLLPDSATLLVADVHLGKARSFRRLGVPVPSGTTAQTLSTLAAAIRESAARRVVFLGDLLHSRHAQAGAIDHAFMQWRAAHAATELVLVRGNHDEHAGDPPPQWGVSVVTEPYMADGFALCHFPQARPGAYVLAGHWHPCISLGGRAGQRLRLPCFWLGDERHHAVGVLPAFGEFTGMHPIQRRIGDQVYVLADGQVRALPVPEQSSAQRIRPDARAA